jgi:hypothetical protein
MILIIGLIAGPAVSLYGSPTVSQVTAALCASEPFQPKLPSSIYFFALSQAQPQVVIDIATNIQVRIEPISSQPKACFAAVGPATGPRARARPKKTKIGTSTGIRAGATISLRAALVTISTVLP